MSVDFSPSQNLNAYVLTNPLDEAKKYKAESTKNKCFAAISILALGILTLTAVIVTSIYIPVLVPVCLIVGGSLAKLVYGKIFLKYKEKGDQAAEYARHAEGMAKKLILFKRKTCLARIM